MPQNRPQLICFSYHKSGTSLLWHVMNRVSQQLGLSLANHYGEVRRIDPNADIVLLPHSRLRGPIERPYRAIRMIRDPRDIWVSGYLYHLRCTEGWCINCDFDTTRPIVFPQVDYAIAHWPHAAKCAYLESLNSRSYQQNLRQRSRNDGLMFELAGYTGWTMAAMREWPVNQVDALDIRLEAVMADFDAGMQRIFEHFGFSDAERTSALDVARHEDVRRMDDAAMSQRPQISSRTISKWRTFLTEEQIARFENAYGDVISSLGYPLHDSAPAIGAADVHLLAGHSRIKPTVVAPGLFTFIVPAGQQRVQLVSHHPDPRHGRAARQGEIAVREIVVECKDDLITIPADDPRLTEGWRDPEHDGAELRRRTAGAASLPWGWFDAPVKVTIHCPVIAVAAE